MGKIFSRCHIEIFFFFPEETGFDISCKLSGDSLHEISNPVLYEK